eukprot:3126412-Prorocentrum_lima.AAC.1
MGLAVPWDAVQALPPGGLRMTAEIVPLNLLQLVGKEAHLRRTLRELRVRAHQWFNAVSYTHLTLPTICSV